MEQILRSAFENSSGFTPCYVVYTKKVVNILKIVMDQALISMMPSFEMEEKGGRDTSNRQVS